MSDDDFSEEEIPTKPDTPVSKSGKFKICFVCGKLVERAFIQNDKFICLPCSCIKIDGGYSIINKD